MAEREGWDDIQKQIEAASRRQSEAAQRWHEAEAQHDEIIMKVALGELGTGTKGET